ncbi:MAG: DUF2165 family protein [Croceibacterium sp.]
MLDRSLKVLFTTLLGLMTLLYAIDNLINLQASYATFDLVLGMSQNKVFPKGLIPPIGPPLSHIAAWVTYSAEFLTGLVLLWGAVVLYQARGLEARVFRRASGPARLGAGLAVLTWFGLVEVVGGALFQMSQSTVGASSLDNAFKFSVWAFLLLIWLGLPERD